MSFWLDARRVSRELVEGYLKEGISRPGSCPVAGHPRGGLHTAREPERPLPESEMIPSCAVAYLHGSLRRSSSKKFRSIVTCTDPFASAAACGTENTAKCFPSAARSRFEVPA